MADISTFNSIDDPLLPHLRSVKDALDKLKSNKNDRELLDSLLENCIMNFKDNQRYQNDVRFLKIWILYADSIQDFKTVYETLEEKSMCLEHALLYVYYAVYLIAKGDLVEADRVYRIGISRNAQPIEELRSAHADFLQRMSDIVNGGALNKIESKETPNSEKLVNPWSLATINDLLKKKAHEMTKYNGYHASTKNYSGKVPLSSLLNTSRKKLIEIGGKKYQIKGCAGKGGFAHVFKAFLNGSPDDVVALKIQKPPFPWEFYMYRQLDNRISDVERSSFSYADTVHVYSDYSILVCEYVAHGTLQDAINSFVVVGQKMQEALCIYYTIEMLRMLETLHSVGIIHGDFKPDNLLMRYAKKDLTADGFSSRSGLWRDQGLCLIDWGRGIDANLFPSGTQFNGDCQTSCFRCTEIQEKRPWKFQVDTYGLCGIVHMMLHGSFMTVEKVSSSEGKYLYQPNKAPLKRYYDVDLWVNLFTKLLNVNPEDDHVAKLQSLRHSFEEYINSSPQLIKKLIELLKKQKASLCAA
ncbi:non-specific serine/threonine protein kinase [Ranunculus cassubicifolius]